MRRALAIIGVIAFIVAGIPGSACALEKVSIVIPRDSVFVLSYFGAKDAGVFKKYGIDLEIDARPFNGFVAGLPSKQTMATNYPGIEAIDKINQGLPWKIIGGGLTVMNDVFVRKDSPIKSVADLRGKKVGVFSTGSGTFKAARAAMIDADGLDVVKDTNLVQVAPPALFKFLENGSVDAMLNISSFTVDALSEPGKFRILFSPNEYWQKKTGYPIAWSGPLVAWTSWIDQDPKRARDLAAAADASFRWLRDPANLDAAVKKYG
ncbi:MAG: ABC transporter substrate-binding protein, partial [Stellaceae bacterium]